MALQVGAHNFACVLRMPSVVTVGDKCEQPHQGVKYLLVHFQLLGQKFVVTNNVQI